MDGVDEIWLLVCEIHGGYDEDNRFEAVNYFMTKQEAEDAWEKERSMGPRYWHVGNSVSYDIIPVLRG